MTGIEFTVVDNSPDEDKRSVRAVVDSTGGSLTELIAIPPQGLMAARHVGAAHATGDVVAFLASILHEAPRG
jgi:hypothetical protein